MQKLSSGLRYKPVGYCIYCGASQEPLTQEHIVPKGIGGNLKLPKASCESHRRVTASLEQYCQRDMLGSFRIHSGLSKSEVPTTIPHLLIDADGQRSIKYVPPDQYPHMMVLACFPPPGILVGRHPLQAFRRDIWAWIAHGEPERQKAIHGGLGYSSPMFDPVMFSRMLAKIGLGYAEAKAICDGYKFKPLVRELILSGSDTPHHLVGGEFSTPPPNEAMHELKSYWYQNYLVVRIRLFALLGAPVYHVVVGERC